MRLTASSSLTVTCCFSIVVTKVSTTSCALLEAGNNSYDSHSLVIATGGTSVPQTGSTGDGYKFAQDLGHTITELYISI
jgi:predicted flavoprotein YhiN